MKRGFYFLFILILSFQFLLNLTYNVMSSSLISLPTDTIYDIFQHLPTRDLHNLMQCSKKLYIDGKRDFDKRCFRLLPVSLSKESL